LLVGRAVIVTHGASIRCGMNNPPKRLKRGWRAQDRVDRPGEFPIPAYPKVSLPRPAMETCSDRAKKTRQQGRGFSPETRIGLSNPIPFFLRGRAKNTVR